MKITAAIEALGALAHEHRLSLYRLLVERGPEGVSAGAIADRLKIAPSSLTFHLKHLQSAGLIQQRRASRQLIYAADFTVMNELVAYLTENCCGSAATGCASACEPASTNSRSNGKLRRTA
jgi:ArsR family transcriptional regulator, arsenate/arsenite/antimonite-responsive transcriptional repressor